MTLLVFSFVAGVLTVLAPCVLPLLPIIIGGSVAGNQNDRRLRPILIATSLAVSLFVFTILLKATTALVDVSPNVWLYASGGIVIALGIVSLFPSTWEVVADKLHLQITSQNALAKSGKNKGRFVGPILVGAALGPVFSSCSPTYAFILATVLPRDFATGVVDLIAYCLGLVFILLVVSIYGRAAIQRVKWMANPHGAFRRGLGVLFIVVGVAIITGYDVKAQTWVANHSPFDITNVDKALLGKATGDTQSSQKSDSSDDMGQPDVFNVKPYAAPEFAGLENWINSDPQTLQQLRGKVVLVDFWTYSCINCVRSVPHVEQWYEQYKDQDFVVVGVHAPEFSFERDPKNVDENTRRLGITYPVALDNDRKTWNAFENRYWPAHYLIDKEGIVRRVHFGEGEYDKTERAIKTLIGDKSKGLTEPDSAMSASDGITPETYFGNLRAERFDLEPRISEGEHDFTGPAQLERNRWSLDGRWKVDQQQITSASPDSTLRFHVRAKNVYVVVGGGVGSITATVDGGATTTIAIDGPRLYPVTEFNEVQDATITLRVPAGVSLNTFTFG